MGVLSLAYKDIIRHKNRSFLFISVQSLITASGTFFYCFSSYFQNQIYYSLNNLNYSLIQIFNSYLKFLLGFSIIIAILVASILSSILVIARMNDLAILLAMGGTFKSIQRVPLAQSFILTLISGFVGWIIGLVGFSCYSIINGIDIIELLIIFDIPFAFIYIVTQLIGMYFIAGFFVNYIIRKNFKEIIGGQYCIDDIKNHEKIYGIPTKGKIGLLLAYLFNKRSSISTVFAIGIFILITFSTLGVLGGNIITVTSDSYIDHGYGTNVLVITTTESFSSVLQMLYNPNSKIIFDPNVSNSRNLITREFINQISTNELFETRYLTLGRIKMQKPIFNASKLEGETTPINTYFWGVDSSFSIFNYFTRGDNEEITSPSSGSVYIGDGIVQAFWGENTLNSLIPLESNVQRFRICGLIMDPFARGYCVFINKIELFALRNIYEHDFTNVIFVKNPSQDVFNLIDQFNYHSFFLDHFKTKYKVITSEFWISSSIAFIPITITTGLSLVAYTGIFARVVVIKDLKILHALGGKPKMLKQVILWVNVLNLRIAPFAILFGFSLAYGLLIPDPVYPSIYAWIILAMEFGIIGLIIICYLRLLFNELYSKL